MTARTYLAALPFAALLAFSTAMPVFAASDGSVMAIVNGKKIERSEVEQAVKKLQRMKPQSDPRALFPDAVDMLITQTVLDELAAKENIKDSSDYKKRLDALNKEVELRKQELDEQKAALPAEIARQIYVERRIKDKITDKAIKDAYNKFRLENEGKIEMNANFIAVKTKEEADQIIKELNEGGKFEELAKQRSSAGGDGSLGWFTREQMPAEFSEAVFKLKKGEWSKEPLKSNFGWHVLYVNDKRPRGVPTYEQAKEAFRGKLLDESVTDLISRLRDKAQVEMFDEKGRPLELPAPVGKKADAGDKKDEAQ